MHLLNHTNRPTVFFCLEKFLKKLADALPFTIQSIYYNVYRYLSPFSMEFKVDLPEILCLMEVSFFFFFLFAHTAFLLCGAGICTLTLRTTTCILTPFLIGSHNEMFTNVANKAVKMLHHKPTYETIFCFHGSPIHKLFSG